jgi:hypothetical protein
MKRAATFALYLFAAVGVWAQTNVASYNGADPCTQSIAAAAGQTNPILDWTVVSVTNPCNTDPNAQGVAGQTILLPAKTVITNTPWIVGGYPLTGQRVRGQQPGISSTPVSVLQAGPTFPDGFGTNLANVGGISSATANNNGMMYTNGDVLNVIEMGAFAGQVTVNTSSGSVTTVTGIYSAGQGYQLGTFSTTCLFCHNSGASGATINVTGLSGATNGNGTTVYIASSPPYVNFSASQDWVLNQFLRIYNAQGGTVYYGAITSTSSGTNPAVNPSSFAAALSACPSTAPCNYMVETPLVILGGVNAAPANNSFNNELSGVMLDCNHVVGCAGWVDIPSQEGTVVDFVSAMNFSGGCGRIVAPNGGPFTRLGCPGSTDDPVADTLPLLVCSTPSASREIRDFTFAMIQGQLIQPNVGVDIEATCAGSGGSTGVGQTLIEAGHIERVTTSYLIGQGGNAVNNVIIRHVTQANGTTPTQVVISNSSTKTGNILLEGLTCGGLTLGTLLNDLITTNNISCNGATGVGGSGGPENMGFYFLGEVAASGLRTVLSSFSGVLNQFNTVQSTTLNLANSGGAIALSAAGSGSASVSVPDTSGTLMLTSGTIPINQVVSATAAIPTIADGNNPLTINCAQTSNTQSCANFGETSAATGGSANNELTVSTAANSASTVLNISQGATSTVFPTAALNISQLGAGTGNTGATNVPALNITSLWNNNSLNGCLICASLTNTLSVTGSFLMNLKAGMGGSTSEFSVTTVGNVTAVGNITSGATIKAPLFATSTNCAGVGTAANPSVVTCSAAPAGAFSCSTSASGGTCVVDTTAVTANSEIIVTQVSDEGTRLTVTCNTTILTLSHPLVSAKSSGTSFTVTLPTFATNPICFDYVITN